MLRCFFYSCLGSLLLLFSAHARADYHPGYVITLAGDTLHGRVNYQTGPQTTFKCRFRPAGGAAITYEPAQLRGYGIPELAIRYAVRAVPTRVVLNAIEGSAHTEPRPVFLEVLVAGPATLYYRADGTEKAHYYIETESAGIRPLVREVETITTANGQHYARERPTYRGELATAFRPCPEVQRTVATVELKTSSLGEAVRRYNECIAGPAPVVLPSSQAVPRVINVEVMAGAQVGTIRFEGNGVDVHGADIWGQTTLLPGLGLQVRPELLKRHLALRLELIYERQQYDREYDNPLAYSYARRQEVRINLHNFRLPLTVRYFLLNGRWQPFLEAGGSLGVNQSYSAEYRYAGQAGSTFSTWKPLLAKPDMLVQGILVGGGLSVPVLGHPFSLGMRTEFNSGMADGRGVYVSQTQFMLLLSYGLLRATR